MGDASANSAAASMRSSNRRVDHFVSVEVGAGRLDKDRHRLDHCLTQPHANLCGAGSQTSIQPVPKSRLRPGRFATKSSQIGAAASGVSAKSALRRSDSQAFGDRFAVKRRVSRGRSTTASRGSAWSKDRELQVHAVL